MHPVVVVCVISLGLVLALGVVLTCLAPRLTPPSWYPGVNSRVAEAVDGSIRSLGRLVPAAVVLMAGFGFTLLVCYVLGEVAQALERSVDVPLFGWFRDRQLSGAWHGAWKVLTQLGNRSKTQPAVVVGAVVLAVLWARSRRRWWVPLMLLPVGYLFEKFGQMFLKLMVHRGHPPTTLGTWPSGGCARLILVGGLIIYLALRWRGASRRTWVAAWSLLAFLGAIEAYSRTYLLKHWFTDVVGGLVYGVMALVVLIATIAVLDRRAPGGTR